MPPQCFASSGTRPVALDEIDEFYRDMRFSRVRDARGVKGANVAHHRFAPSHHHPISLVGWPPEAFGEVCERGRAHLDDLVAGVDEVLQGGQDGEARPHRALRPTRAAISTPVTSYTAESPASRYNPSSLWPQWFEYVVVHQQSQKL